MAPTKSSGTYRHISYDRRWSEWQPLGGIILESKPAAVSWGFGRIDVFVRGRDNTLYHKRFDGDSWRPPSKRCEDAWGLRPRGIGPREQSGGAPLRCWPCSRWSHCVRSPAHGEQRTSSPANGLVPQEPSYLLQCVGALVRKELRAQEETFCRSSREADTVKVPRTFVERLTDVVCYAA